MRMVVAGATGAIGKQAGAVPGRGRLPAELLASQASTATMWRWLAGDPIRPWHHHLWIFPRDPGFAAKATVVLDMYQRVCDGAPLGAGEYVVSADEKTSIQARCRCHPTLPPARVMRVEPEYERRGALAYLAAWDLHHAR